VLVKICGLSTPETLDVALSAGADMIGLVFHPKSPRFVDPARGALLAARARRRAQVVALVVDLDDLVLDAVVRAVRPDWLQLHGSESPIRVAEIRARTGCKVMKAVGVATADDLPLVALHRDADLLLIDAKPPPDAAYPGGHGKPFDWSILSGLNPTTRYLLSGGLTPANVGEAIRRVRPFGVDVSSGVESSRGIKDPDLIRAFVAAARAAG
jgi:phosphoribosylanthranilate isomerase